MARAEMLEHYIAGRYASTPLMLITSADPASTIDGIRSLEQEIVQTEDKGKTVDVFVAGENCPLVQWDCRRGISAINKAGQTALSRLGGGLADCLNPGEALTLAEKLPPGSVFFFHAAHNFIKENDVQQGIWNLRDFFKGDFRALVMLAPEMDVPMMLRNDVMVLDEPLPDKEELRQIVQNVYEGAKQSDPKIKLATPAEMDRAIDALCGLPAYPAEQATATCITSKGLNLDWLWDRKRQAIATTQGLSVGKSKGIKIGGLQNALSFFESIIHNYSAIILMDEGEKMTAGVGTDTSGSTTKQMGRFLTWSSEQDIDGVIEMGIRGAGKTILPEYLAEKYGLLLIMLDFARAEGGIVGESVANLDACFKVIDAVTAAKPGLFVMTTNNVEALSPEFRRRFNLCTFFFDIPDEDEKKEIWPIFLNKFSIPKQPLPNDDGWTGSEIKSCCKLASIRKKKDGSKMSLVDAAKFIVPVMRSNPESVGFMRTMAHGRYVSASKEGTYEFSELKEKQIEDTKRLVRAVSVMPGMPKLAEA